MKRNKIVALISIMLSVVLLVFLPTSLAEKDQKKAKAPQKTPTFSGLFMSPQERSSAKPISQKAVYFGESAPVTEIAAHQRPANVDRNKKPIDHDEWIEKKRGANVQPQISLEEEFEKNRFNREITRPFDYNAKTA